MQKMRCIIVEDEPIAREALAAMLEAEPDVELLETCRGASDGYSSITRSRPDLVFMDIMLSGQSGLDVLFHLQQEKVTSPQIVICSGHSEYALQAFDFKATDYLLKPFSDERFQQCLYRVRQSFIQRQAFRQQQRLDSLLNQKTGQSLQGLLHSLEQVTGIQHLDMEETISLKSGTEWLRLMVKEIIWVEAAGDYMCVHTEDESHIVRSTMHELAEKLAQRNFIRASRSAILNGAKLARLTPNSNGEYIATMSNGTNIKVGRKYKLQFPELSNKTC